MEGSPQTKDVGGVWDVKKLLEVSAYYAEEYNAMDKIETPLLVVITIKLSLLFVFP